MSRFRFVSDHRSEYSVKRLCRLCEVSCSGFCAWLTRPPSARALADRVLLVEIERIHRDSRCPYGAPRVHGRLARRGVRVGCKRVTRLMRRERLVGVNPRRKWRRGRPDIAPAPDLLQRDFTATRPNQLWVADITEFPTDEGVLYLAGVRDLCHRGLVGWATGPHEDASSTRSRWRSLAANPTRPGWYITPTAAARVDSSGRNTSFAFTRRLVGEGLVGSMGTVGDALDNAMCENLIGTMKTEKLNRQAWRSVEDVRAAVFEWIETWYNRRRRHSSLGYLSPLEFESQHHNGPTINNP